jgi:hypothetical protein
MSPRRSSNSGLTQRLKIMATAASTPVPWKNGYPTSDGKPMAETDWHRDLMNVLIQTLQVWYATAGQ